MLDPGMPPGAGGVTFAAVSYAAAAAGFGATMLVALRRRLATPEIAALLPALLVATTCAAVFAWDAYNPFLSPLAVHLVDVLRAGAWLAYVALVLPRNSRDLRLRTLPWLNGFMVVVGGLAGLFVAIAGEMLAGGNEALPLSAEALHYVFGVVASALTLIGAEQAARNLTPAEYWARKHILIGVGLMQAYDLVMFTGGWLDGQLPDAMWQARGFVQLVATLPILLGVRRVGAAAGRHAVRTTATFFVTTLIAVGFYMVVVAVMGVYARSVGGTWGGALQVLMLAVGVAALALLAFSAEVRARFRVWVAKNFAAQKYDYREEWLRFTRTIDGEGKDERQSLRERVVEAMARITGSPRSGLWVAADDALVPAAGELCTGGAPTFPMAKWLKVLTQRQWIMELSATPPPGLTWEDVPAWFRQHSQAWLVVPLVVHGRMEGLVLLAPPLAAEARDRRLTWEDIDLVRTAATQAAGVLATERAIGELGEMRQFEAFNRLGAFLMHDLKNVLAQQQLVVQNFPRFRDHPGFIDDAIATVENATRRMASLIQQLQAGDAQPAARPVNLRQVCEDVVAATGHRAPAPELRCAMPQVFVLADQERLQAVLTHVVRNAQDATTGSGSVVVEIVPGDARVTVCVSDTGTGMTEAFVRERLFRPFDSTKGDRGMGIGAFQAREYLRALGGDVEVESEVGHGTRFSLLFPAAQGGYTGVDAHLRSA